MNSPSDDSKASKEESKDSSFGKRGMAVASLLGLALVGCETTRPLPPRDVPAAVYGSPAMMMNSTPAPGSNQ